VPDPTTGNDDPIEDELEVEDNDDLREDAAALFGIDADDGPFPSMSMPSTTRAVEGPRWRHVLAPPALMVPLLDLLLALVI
jgi:hypothetical protein